MSKRPLFLTSLFLLLLSLTVQNSYAQFGLEQQGIQPFEASEQVMNDRQRELVQKLVRENFGPIELQGATSELYYLQKILDKGLISKDATFDLQAMGVVLGDIMAKNLSLQWVTYEDERGKSRALRFGQTDQLLFPVTMISRRYQNGLATDVQALYNEAKTWADKLRKSTPYNSQ